MTPKLLYLQRSDKILRRDKVKMSRQVREEEVRLLEGPKVSFVISLVAGILIIAGGALGLFGFSLIGMPLVGFTTE